MNDETKQNDSKDKHDIKMGLLFIAMGIYLMVGAFVGFAQEKWPIFMPPQLDIFGLLFKLFGEALGAYIGAAFLFMLGLGCFKVASLGIRAKSAKQVAQPDAMNLRDLFWHLCVALVSRSLVVQKNGAIR